MPVIIIHLKEIIQKCALITQIHYGPIHYGPIHGRAYTWEGLYMGGPIHGRAYTWEGLYMGGPIHGRAYTMYMWGLNE